MGPTFIRVPVNTRIMNFVSILGPLFAEGFTEASILATSLSQAFSAAGSVDFILTRSRGRAGLTASDSESSRFLT